MVITIFYTSIYWTTFEIKKKHLVERHQLSREAALAVIVTLQRFVTLTGLLSSLLSWVKVKESMVLFLNSKINHTHFVEKISICILVYLSFKPAWV